MGIKGAEEDTRTIAGDKDSSLGDKVVSVGKVEGIRIRSKILNTSSRGSTARAQLRATISRVDRTSRMTRTSNENCNSSCILG